MDTDSSLCVKNEIRLRSGLWFDFRNPTPDQFTLADIAGSLSKICRFGGHCDHFYSVAEHCYRCAVQAAVDGHSHDVQLAALMHDATEALAGDMVRPLKIMLPAYSDVERRVEKAIAEKFGIDFAKHKAITREIDNAMLIAERDELFSKDDVEWAGERNVRRLSIKFDCWCPSEAEKSFTAAANVLLRALSRGADDRFLGIAFTGYARSGKDEAAQALLACGYERRCFGDVIKKQLDGLCLRELGYSAFTTDDAQKARIRPLLEHWGDANYDAIFAEFFRTLPRKVVNTRLVRLLEAEEWRRRGGLIVEIQRPGVSPASSWEEARLAELRQAGYIDHTICNSGEIGDLHAAMRNFAKQMECRS